MAGPFITMARKLAVRRHSSNVKTGIMPLSQVTKAAVFLDTTNADANVARKVVQNYFSDKNIPVLFIAPQQWDLNHFGWMKRNSVIADWHEDLFVTLAGPENFASEYAARCSRAKFKVGRSQLSGNVFDLVVSDPENSLPRQPQVFNVMRELLDKII